MNDRFEKLFREQYDAYVKRMSYRTGSMESAEDVVMEAFARAIRYKDSFNPENDDRIKLEPWFNTIMVNALRDFKKDQLLNGMTQDYDEKDDELVFDKLEDKNLLARISKQIAACKEPTQSILRFLFLKGYKPKEVQQVVANTNHRTIAVMAHRFRQTMLAEYGDVL